MSDAMSHARKERLKAEEYLLKKGWIKIPHDIMTSFWKDFFNPESEAMWLDEAWEIQYLRDKENGSK